MDGPLLLLFFAAAVALWMLLRRLAGGGRYGAVRPDPAAGEAYRAGRVDPALAYHLSGPDHRPYALLGLDRRWTLVDSPWKPRDPTPAGMAGHVQDMQARAAETLSSLQGYAILDDRGGIIGNAFADTGFAVTVWIVGEHRVAIATPEGAADQTR